MKKIIFMMAFVFLGESLNVAFGQSGSEVGGTFTAGNGITYKITNLNPNYVQIGTGVPADANTSFSGALTIPATVTYDEVEYTVTAVSENAFKSNTGITSVTIPNSVTSIGYTAFALCNNLLTVTIGDNNVPANLATIETAAFYQCQNLTTVIIGNNVKTISYASFLNCNNLATLTLGESVETIGDWAFTYCGLMGTLTIPNSVKTIGNYAFE
ncbi:MAG: leucine-rich repeat domain-containing protein [Bacteroidales bacterium]|jgi:hypothetical protein|nr:leucine-rich repeat domain-containing protein [Bacteroidales bacterium]